jgi:hypothetical protein
MRTTLVCGVVGALLIVGCHRERGQQRPQKLFCSLSISAPPIIAKSIGLGVNSSDVGASCTKQDDGTIVLENSAKGFRFAVNPAYRIGIELHDRNSGVDCSIRPANAWRGTEKTPSIQFNTPCALDASALRIAGSFIFSPQ